jgi:hypothetical protein
MAAPMLRPLSAGELLDMSFGLFRRMFGTLVLIQLMCMTLPFLLNVYFTGAGEPNPLVVLLVTLVGLILSALASAATAVAISGGYLGAPVNASEALQRAAPRLGVLLVVSLSIGLLVVLASLPFIFLIAGSVIGMTRPDAGGFVVFQVLIGIASLALPLFVVSGVAVATPIVVLEDGRNATAAIGRSWFLTKGYRLRVTGLLFVCLILILIPYAGLLTGGAALASNTGTPLTIWIAAVALAARLLLTPLLYCLITLLYYDLRVRKEGFDLEMLAASLQPA